MRRLLWIAVAASLALWACDRGDGDLPLIYREMTVPADRLASPDVQRQGRAIYRQHCDLCHGEEADGRGEQARDLLPPPRDLTKREWQAHNDDRHVYYAIAEGRHGTPMPPWKATLSPGEIWSIVAYIRSLASQPPPPADSAPAASEPSGVPGQDRR